MVHTSVHKHKGGLPSHKMANQLSSLHQLVSLAGLPITPIVEQNLDGVKFWGEVQSVVDINRDIMLKLVRFVLDSSAQCKEPVR